MLFTSQPAEHSTKLKLTISNTTLNTNKDLKILGPIYNPKHTFSTEHHRQSKEHHTNTESIRHLS